jgi:geranylgeranyl diphosphate synthase type II
MVDASPLSTSKSWMKNRDLIDSALARYADLGGGCPARLREAIGYSLLAPGKRLRPQLVLLAAEACGCSGEAALPAACAVEMVHAYSLIHDDLPAMDDDDLRRGRRSCHVEFDEATAILAGDALHVRAFEILARDVKPAEVAAACCVALAQAAGAEGMVGGQADDLAAEQTGGGLRELESIHRRKTSALLVVSLRLGGLVARATAPALRRLDSYGEKLGLAFQIVDDLLDDQGSQTRLGKRTGKDADRGKLTFPALLGVEESRRRANRLIDEACQALDGLEGPTQGLLQLARYVVQRDH